MSGVFGAGVFRAVQQGLTTRPSARYAAALVLTAVALGLRLLIGLALPGAPFVTLVPAIMICAYALGRGPALLCLLLSMVVAWLAFIHPSSSTIVSSVWLTVAYLAIGTTIIVMFDRLKRLIQRLERSEADREALMRDLESRVAARTAELSATNDRLRYEMGERAKAEAAIAHFARLEAMGELVGGVSHDFNNFLHIIVGNLDMARRRGARPGPAMQIHVDAALDAARKATVLTQRLLAFGRKQTLEPAAVDVNALIEGIADMLGHTLGPQIALDIDLQPGLPAAWIDGVQLESAILNLGANARDAMPDGGKLNVTTRAVPADDGRVHIEVTVADTGQGMPAEVAMRAFEPFFTTKAPGRGTGLGLSQIHGFICQSGGDIRLNTAEGQGTSLVMWLPDCDNASATVMLRQIDSPVDA